MMTTDELRSEALIDSVLEAELSMRQDALRRAQIEKQRGLDVYIPDYEDDVRNIERAIALWKAVRP